MLETFNHETVEALQANVGLIIQLYLLSQRDGFA